MELQKQAICIYGASRSSVARVFKHDAFSVGELVASKGFTLVSGGGGGGLMGWAIDGALHAGGNTIGVIPQFMVDKGWYHEGLTEMIVCPDMHTRKRTMAELSGAVIALPGGVGTLEELLEIITWRELHLYSGKVVILNTDNYYAPLLEMFSKIISLKFGRAREQYYIVADTPEEAVDAAVSGIIS